MARRFGDYSLLTKLGEGPMGEVWSAHQESQDRRVVLKLIKPGYFATATDVQRFLLELENLKNLNHPNIIAVHDVGQQDGQYYFTMEPANAGSLAEQIAAGRWKIENNPDTQRAIARLIKTLTDAIDYAHRRGVIHRNLKPSNILLDENDAPHLTDLGLARFESDTMFQIEEENPAAISFYAPEQVGSGSGPVTTATDIYGLGTIFYELLTGHRPFEAKTGAETVRMVMEKKLKKPRACNPSIDPVLESICLKCLEKNPGNRPASATELSLQLKNWLAGCPVSWQAPERTRETSSESRRKRALAFGMIAWLLLSAGLAGTSSLWWKHVSTPEAWSRLINMVRPDPVSARTDVPRVNILEFRTSTNAVIANSQALTNAANDRTNGVERSKPPEDNFREAVQAIPANSPTNSSTLAMFAKSTSTPVETTPVQTNLAQAGVVQSNVAQTNLVQINQVSPNVIQTNRVGPNPVHTNLDKSNAVESSLANSSSTLETNSTPLPSCVNLSRYYTSTLRQGETNKNRGHPTGDNLVGLPASMQVDSVEFQVRGVVQLAGSDDKELGSKFPKAIERVPVGRSVTRLHFLHGTVWPAAPQTIVARVKVQYADGKQAEIPIIYGVDVRELIYDPSSAAVDAAWKKDETGLLALATGKSRTAVWKLGAGKNKNWMLIWYGSAGDLPSIWRTMKEGTPSPRRWGTRVYQLTWVNRRPEAVIDSFDYESAMSGSAPFLLAATVEP